jgi:hypothetical protein
MNEQYKGGDLRLCKACNKAIRFVDPYWEHVSDSTGVQPRHIGEPWEPEAEKPSGEIKTGYVNFDANDFYALQDKLTAANARIAELERQLAPIDANVNIYTEIIAVDPMPTTRLLYADLTKNDCFDEFDKAVGRKQMSAILRPGQHDPVWA